MSLLFYKYQGTGNDFVMIDNRTLFFPKEDVELVAKLCDCRFGIGADGLILLENDPGYDFKMVYFNADGNQSSMCGNGGRCLVAFAQQLGIITDKTTFIATDGEHHATIHEDGNVSLQMLDVSKIETHKSHWFLNTGSPHHVEMVSGIGAMNVKETGASIRYGAPYFKEGSNVNFVEKKDTSTFTVRTYERGVEDETYSCGTGVTAVAIAMNYSKQTPSNEVVLETPGGVLKVRFNPLDDRYTDVWLTGPATFVYKGEISW